MAAVFQPLFDELAREQEFWTRNRAVFMERYEDQFVAVKHGQVVLTDPDLVSFLHRLREAGLWPDNDVWFEYVTDKWKSLIL